MIFKLFFYSTNIHFRVSILQFVILFFYFDDFLSQNYFIIIFISIVMKRIICLVFIIAFFSSGIYAKNCGGSVQCSCGDTVTSSYVMQENLHCSGNGLIVKNHLNCNGFTIGGEKNGFGLKFDLVDKKNVHGCVVDNFSQGVLFSTYASGDRAFYNNFYNNTYRNNEVGFYLGKYHVDTDIISSFFIGNTISIYAPNSPRTLVVNNTFYDSTFNYTYSSSLQLCDDGDENIFLGDKASSCSCFIPLDGMKFNSDETLCSGSYYLPSGIEIRSRSDTRCLGTHIYGDGKGVGVIGKGAEITTFNGCTISNYTKGFFFTYESRAKKYYGFYNQISNRNTISNITLFDVDIGFEFDYYTTMGTSRAERIENSTIYAKDTIFNNYGTTFLHATNNNFGLDSREFIESRIYDSSRVNIDGFYTLEHSDQEIFANLVSMNSSHFVFDFYLSDRSFLNEDIIIFFEKEGNIIFEDEITLNFFYQKNLLVPILRKNNVDSISIFIKKNHLKVYRKNFDLEGHNLQLKNISEEQSLTIKEYIKKEIVLSENSDFSTSLVLSLGDIGSLVPYSFDINSSQNQINIKSSTIEGLLVALDYFIRYEDTFKQDSLFVKSRSENINAYLKFFSLINNSIASPIVEEGYAKSIFLNNEYYNYSIKKISPTSIVSFDSAKQIPIVMSGGLWSSIDSFYSMGKKFAQEGYTVYLIEMNGGDHLECNSCYNYYYEDLISTIFPELLSYVLEIDSSQSISYIGHSNGARVFLDSLSQGFFDSSILEKTVLLGAPGAFEDLSFFGGILNDRGNSSLSDLYLKNLTHVSQGDVAHSLSKYSLVNNFDLLLDLAGFYMNFGDTTKISLNLFEQYITWIQSDSDEQPGSIVVDDILLIAGNPPYLSDNDVIVSTKDMESIFENIKSVNKIYKEVDELHFQMTDNENLFFIIKNYLEGKNETK